MDKKNLLNRPLPAAFLIVLAGCIAYAHTFHVPFVLDDLTSITGNPVIKDLANFYANLSGFHYNPNRFLGYLTFALNYHFGGLSLPDYHLVNLAIHLAAALLVYILIVLSFRTPQLAASRLAPRAGEIALVTALLFTIHPVQTEAVTYIVQRVTSLATFFYLLSLICYVQARLRMELREREEGRPSPLPQVLFMTGAVLSAVLAMKSKEIAFTLPFAAALYEGAFFRGAVKRRLLYLLPLLLTAAIIPLTLMLPVLSAAGPTGGLAVDLGHTLRAQTNMPRLHYLFTEFRVIVTYLRLLILPIHQNIDYDYPVYSSLLAPPVFLSFLLLSAFFALAIYLFYRSGNSRHAASGDHSPTLGTDPGLRLVSFGILWFFLTLSVSSSLIPIRDVIVEHRLYLPSVGAFSAVVTGGFILAEKINRHRLRQGLAVLTAGVLLALGMTTWMRNEVWRSSVTLWQDAAAKSPHKARPFLNLGAVLGEAGRMKEAIASLRQATRIEPDNPEPYGDLGAALASMGRKREALQALSRAVKLAPDNPDLLNNLGIVLSDLGRRKEAVTVLTKAVKIQPHNARACYNLGRVLFQTGRYAEAATALRQAIKVEPNYDNALIELALALDRVGEYQKAWNLLIPQFSRFARRLDAHFAIGMAAHCLGDRRIAERELSVLARNRSGYAEQLRSFMQKSCE